MKKQENTPSSSNKKFFFDVHNFDENEKKAEDEPPPPPTFSEEELAAARDVAYKKGKADGIAESQASFEKHTLDTLNIIRNHFSMLFEEEERRARVFETEAVQLACTIFARAFPAMNEQYGLDEIRVAIEKVLETVHEQPEILIDVAPAYVEAIQTHITGLLRKDGGPRCIVRGNDRLESGQCTMSWANGTATRNSAAIATQIVQQITQVLAGKAILTDNGQDTAQPVMQDGDGHE